MILVWFLAPSEHAAAQGQQWRVDAPSHGAVYMRLGPGREHGVLQSLPHGALARKLDQAGRWVKMRHARGVEGWIHQSFLRLAVEQPSPATGFNAGCADPLSLDRMGETAAYIRDIIPLRIKIALDACRNLTLSSRGRPSITGKLHQFVTEVNEAWTKVTYFGLAVDERSVFLSGNFVSAQHASHADVATWLITFQDHRRRILELAGYTRDPEEARLARLAAYHAEMLRMPNLGPVLRDAGRLSAQDASNGAATSKGRSG